ncbi:MAG: hypothetical protein JWO23_577 [Solirubrobacterales bacterium]|nr:hypothetical protein [Solirubrobacterales bacterium]
MYGISRVISCSAMRQEGTRPRGRLTVPPTRAVIMPARMTRSTVRLPRDVRASYEVYLNGVRQQLGVDYTVRSGSLVFDRELRKDRISRWRWLLGAWGVGTYRQNDSVDVRYEAADGSPRVAEALEIEPG